MTKAFKQFIADFKKYEVRKTLNNKGEIVSENLSPWQVKELSKLMKDSYVPIGYAD